MTRTAAPRVTLTCPSTSTVDGATRTSRSPPVSWPATSYTLKQGRLSPRPARTLRRRSPRAGASSFRATRWFRSDRPPSARARTVSARPVTEKLFRPSVPWTWARPSASSRPSPSASRVPSSRCVRSTPVVSPARTSPRVCRGSRSSSRPGIPKAKPPSRRSTAT